METIGQRARRLRIERGLKVKEVAYRAQVTGATVSHLELDQHGTSFFNIIEIARVLNVSLDYIAYGKE